MADEEIIHTDPAADPVIAVDPNPEPMTAADRLRVFEDEHLGADAVRIDGKIERGVGSPFSKMEDEHRKTYAALEKLIVTEQKVADARAALLQAEIDHAAAEVAVNA